eukprot:CAMPEP_0206542800 /NCGR_PEP_ID=MMETSP0325_2-20121206/10409_1 /ASSEMBLY_ACC=CAM_ASM_000347 /TAXON_ID=2866 /ORGANISM="Crypthecodinium cohnii, Strain Seligo" /LENGTH=83 /DNA_ID=CAMNT_0054040969 /DNA_START=362 /DNA_END=614 /DNA_ORIENTATION=+
MLEAGGIPGCDSEGCVSNLANDLTTDFDTEEARNGTVEDEPPLDTDREETVENSAVLKESWRPPLRVLGIVDVLAACKLGLVP